MNYIDGFPCIEPSLHPWDKAYLIVVNDHFDVFLIFTSIFIRAIGLKFSFCVGSLCGFGISGIVIDG